MTITIYDDVALNNTEAAQRLITKHGMQKARTHQDLVQKLKHLANKGGVDKLAEIARIHPHRKLIMDACKDEIEQYANACGCAFGSDGEISSLQPAGRPVPVVDNKDTGKAEAETTGFKLTDTHKIILGCAAIVALAIIFKG